MTDADPNRMVVVQGDGCPDLRTLAQAVVSAYEMFYGERNASVGRDYAVIDDCRARYYDACKAVEAALGLQAQSVDHASARAILAALDAERAQGYAAGYDEGINDGMTK